MIARWGWHGAILLLLVGSVWLWRDSEKYQTIYDFRMTGGFDYKSVAAERGSLYFEFMIHHPPLRSVDDNVNFHHLQFTDRRYQQFWRYLTAGGTKWWNKMGFGYDEYGGPSSGSDPGADVDPNAAIGSMHYTVLRIPIWCIAMFFAADPLIFTIRGVQRKFRYREGQCKFCGYDLRATPEQCPECGNVPVVKSGVAK